MHFALYIAPAETVTFFGAEKRITVTFLDSWLYYRKNVNKYYYDQYSVKK